MDFEFLPVFLGDFVGVEFFAGDVDYCVAIPLLTEIGDLGLDDGKILCLTAFEIIV